MKDQSLTPRLLDAILAAVLVWSVIPLASAASAEVAASTPQSRLALATTAQTQFDEAMNLTATDPSRARELFQLAAAGFQLAADQGARSGEVYFNLGNALVQSGKVGEGIGAFLEADRLLPGDPRISTNLAHARTLVARAVAAPRSVGWIDRAAASWNWLSLDGRRTVSLSLWIALWVVVTGGLWFGWRASMAWRSATFALAAICVVFSTTVIIDTLRHAINRPGVIVDDSVVVRKGNGEGFTPSFNDPLPQGVEFTLIEARPGWYHIRLSDGLAGWVKSSQAVVAGERSDPAS
ncbi:MAG: SH3 domain-containing protein [Phycisphaerales bacterium]|nr:SH3 domain-containing protein [Phycisphaerales bacterium]